MYIFFRFLHHVNTCDEGLRPILGDLFSLYMLATIEKSLAQYLVMDLITPAEVNKIKQKLTWFFNLLILL